ncbi:MAG: hypothetical protein H8F28_25710, partial [Fibrella sp.]|nr:hypothetical protein [Armatimonadota bacterium]
MRVILDRKMVGDIVSDVAACIHRVTAVDPIYRHNKDSGDRALNFLDDLPWNHTRERTLADLVTACATDPQRSDAPARLAQAVADGHLGQKTAWHVLGLAVGGFPPDLVVAYLGGPKPAWLTDIKKTGTDSSSGSEIAPVLA